jgi:hypothetical protein
MVRLLASVAKIKGHQGAGSRLLLPYQSPNGTNLNLNDRVVLFANVAAEVRSSTPIWG